MKLKAICKLLLLSAILLPCTLMHGQEAALLQRAENGDPVAQTELGFLYATGEGLTQDFTESLRWFLLAANQGNAGAQFSLAELHSEGLSGEKNYEEAVRWYQETAKQGHAEAQYRLGEMYEVGFGVAQNHEMAFMWTHIAGAMATDTMRGRIVCNRDTIARKLTAEQLQHAQDMARLCLESDYATCQ
jgi:uncharacterized protein